MNGKTIRQSIAILALGLVVMTTGCKQAPSDGAAYLATLQQNLGAPAPASYDNRRRDAVTRIDRALTRAEIYSQYDKATADAYFAQGLDR